MPEFEEWHTSLTNNEQDALDVRLELVSQRGPVLGRPYVDRVHQSRHHNMKEIRLPNGIRVLFAFDIQGRKFQLFYIFLKFFVCL